MSGRRVAVEGQECLGPEVVEVEPELVSRYLGLSGAAHPAAVAARKASAISGPLGRTIAIRSLGPMPADRSCPARRSTSA